MRERKRPIIMLVDDNQATLNMGKNILKEFYEVYALPSAERLFKFLETITPDLILLDIEMSNMNGFDVIKILKAGAQYASIPVIFVTAKSEENDELEGLSLGAVDYVTKPFSAMVLLRRIETHLLLRGQQAELRNYNENLIAMVKEKTSRMFKLQSAILNTIAEIVEFRDTHTGQHINRTQEYMRVLVDYLIQYGIYAEAADLWENVDHIISSTQLHDLGKLFIADNILNKPGKLTAEEFEVIKTHVTKGVGAIRQMNRSGESHTFLKCAEIIAATHHEKWDGTGYPYGLKGEDIHLLGRLMAIADVYDALTSERPYKVPFSPEDAAKIIIEGSGTHFDPTLVKAFIQVQKQFADIATGSEIADDSRNEDTAQA